MVENLLKYVIFSLYYITKPNIMAVSLKNIKQKIQDLFNFDNFTYHDQDSLNGYCAFLDNQKHLLEFFIDYDIDDIDNLPDIILPNGKFYITITDYTNDGCEEPLFETKVSYSSLNKIIEKNLSYYIAKTLL